MQAFEAGHVTERCDIVVTPILGNVGPPHTLVLAADTADHFKTPGIVARFERQSLERNDHLYRPAFGIQDCLPVPDTIPLRDPVGVVFDTAVVQRTCRVHRETKSVAPVGKGVEHEYHMVLRLHVGVAAQLGGNNRGRIGIVGTESDI